MLNQKQISLKLNELLEELNIDNNLKYKKNRVKISELEGLLYKNRFAIQSSDFANKIYYNKGKNAYNKYVRSDLTELLKVFITELKENEKLKVKHFIKNNKNIIPDN